MWLHMALSTRKARGGREGGGGGLSGDAGSGSSQTDVLRRINVKLTDWYHKNVPSKNRSLTPVP
jgi:hypothetical protein